MNISSERRADSPMVCWPTISRHGHQPGIALAVAALLLLTPSLVWTATLKMEESADAIRAVFRKFCDGEDVRADGTSLVFTYDSGIFLDYTVDLRAIKMEFARNAKDQQVLIVRCIGQACVTEGSPDDAKAKRQNAITFVCSSNGNGMLYANIDYFRKSFVPPNETK